MKMLWRVAIVAGAGVLAGLVQGQQQASSTLAVAGHSGQAAVIQKDGRSYVEVEGLARITGGTLGFQGSQIVLTLAGARAGGSAAAPAAASPEKTGFSRDFLRAAIEAMSEIREWRAAIENAVRTSNPVEDSWVAPLRRASESSIAVAAAAAATESDKKAVPLLQNQLNNMRQLSDRMLEMRRNMTYVRPDLLENDPLDQKILACAQGAAAIGVPGGQFEDVMACH